MIGIGANWHEFLDRINRINRIQNWLKAKTWSSNFNHFLTDG
jgi:hypothetical protein